MTYGFRPENWGISAADIEKVERRPSGDPGAVLEDRHANVDITVTLRSGRAESWSQSRETTE